MHNDTTIKDAKISSSIHPEELNDLKVIYDKYALMCDLKNNIDQWQENYVLSFLKDYDEVTDYIPQNQIEEYNQNFCKLYNIQMYDNLTDDFQESNEYHQHFLRKELLKKQQHSVGRSLINGRYENYNGTDKSKFSKKFIVDTTRKQIIEVNTEYLDNLKFRFSKIPNANLKNQAYYAYPDRKYNHDYYEGITYHDYYNTKSDREILCLVGKSTLKHHNRFNYGKVDKEYNFEIAFNAETNEFGYLQTRVIEH